MHITSNEDSTPSPSTFMYMYLINFDEKKVLQVRKKTSGSYFHDATLPAQYLSNAFTKCTELLIYKKETHRMNLTENIVTC